MLTPSLYLLLTILYAHLDIQFFDHKQPPFLFPSTIYTHLYKSLIYCTLRTHPCPSLLAQRGVPRNKIPIIMIEILMFYIVFLLVNLDC
jgi:hypothetical protein